MIVLWGGCSLEEGTLPGKGEDAGKTVIYRDQWGVAHIYAPDAEAGSYAVGWGQAEDRPEELLKNFLRAMGEGASVDGPAALQSDLIARMFDHYGVAQRNLQQLSDRSRVLTEAYVRGVNDFYRAHPQDLPAWWKDRSVDSAMVVAFGRMFLYSWSISDGFQDLARAGIEPGFAKVLRASNEMAVSPGRSAEKAAILVIDPHLSWWGPSRFWEFRIHAGEWVGSGFTLAGFPTIGLGHNQHVAWAMTTGGPDTADIYELTLKPDDPGKYFYDGVWKDLTSREVALKVAGVGSRSIRIQDSHYGPVVATEGRKAYALKTSYAEEVRSLDAWLQMNRGEDYRDVVRALELKQLFPQNVMVADDRGNIYYQRTGRVPVRPEGYDWSRPVDGATSKTEWQGFHANQDLVQILNPPQGYMQNCNIPPDAMMPGSPLQPGKYRDYIFSDRSHGKLGGWSNPRGARAVELLSSDASVTAEAAMKYALDIHPYGSERWIDSLRQGDGMFGAEMKEIPEYSAAIGDLLNWDQELDGASTGALKFYYWKEQIHTSSDPLLLGIPAKLNHFYPGAPSTASENVLSPAELKALVQAFVTSMQRLKLDYGRLDLAYGDVFRVGRDGKSWSVGGGGDFGTSTLRSIGFGKPRQDKTRWGEEGQTSTQVIVLSNPIRSWTAPPIGQSDRPDSPHFADQAEKLFSPRTMKPTWWTPGELKDHIESRIVLEVPKF